MAISVEFTYVPGYPKETYSNSGGDSSVTAKYYCAWGDRLTFAKELLGYRAGIIRIPPTIYASGTGGLLWAKTVDIEPHGGLVQDTGEYVKAIVTCIYGVMPYNPLRPQIFNGYKVHVTETITPSTEFLTLGRSNIGWYDGTKIDEIEAPALIVRMFDWSYTIHNVPIEQRQQLAGLIDLTGKINSNACYSYLWQDSFLPGTLLAGNSQITHSLDPSGERTLEITMNYTFRATGWNKFPRVSKPDTNGNPTWEYIYTVSGGASVDIVYPYESADFSGFVL